MKISILTFSLLCFTYCFSYSQWQKIKLSNKISTEEKDLTGFNKIDACCDFEVFVRFSKGKESVKIEANENLHPYIVAQKMGKTLKLGIKKGIGTYGKKQLSAYITVKEIMSFEGSGDVVFELENQLNTEDVSIKLAGDSQLSGKMKVKNLVAVLRGDSKLNLSGSANILELDAREIAK